MLCYIILYRAVFVKFQQGVRVLGPSRLLGWAKDRARPGSPLLCWVKGYNSQILSADYMNNGEFVY